MAEKEKATKWEEETAALATLENKKSKAMDIISWTSRFEWD